MGRLSKEERQAMIDGKSSSVQSTTAPGRLSREDRLAMIDGKAPAARVDNSQKNAQYIQRTQAAQRAYLDQDRVMDMAINTARNIAAQRGGYIPEGYKAGVSRNTTGTSSGRGRWTQEDEDRWQQKQIDYASDLDIASSKYEGPTRKEKVKTTAYDINDIDLVSNDWNPGEEKEYEYEKTVRNERYKQLAREERDALIDEYARAVNNNNPEAAQQAYLKATEYGGFDQLMKEQSADAANDPTYAARLRGVDLDSMSRLQRFGATLRGIAGYAGRSLGSDYVLGNISQGYNMRANQALEDYGPALEQTARRWYWGIVNGYDDPEIENNVRAAAAYIGGDAYADDVVRRVRERANQAINSGEDAASFEYGLLDGINPEQGKLWENVQSEIADTGIYEAINEWKTAAEQSLQRAQDVNNLQDIIGYENASNIVRGAGTALENAADAGIATLLGLSGSGLSYLPFIVRSFGGSYATEMQNATAGGTQPLTLDAEQKARLKSGMSAGIEYLTERMWSMGGALSGRVTGGGAWDDLAQDKLADIISGLVKSPAGAEAVLWIGERLLGGVTEGLEEVAGNVIERMLVNARIMPGEEQDISDWWEETKQAYSGGFWGGIFGEATNIVSTPIQQSQIGKQIKDGNFTFENGTKLTVDDMVNLANTEGMEDTTLGKTFKELSKDLSRNYENFSDREIGKLYEAYAETMDKHDEGVKRINAAIDKVDSGEEITRADVNRLTNNFYSARELQQMAEEAGQELNLDGNITERKASVEAVLRALASDSTALSNAQAENAQAETENAATPVSAPNPFLMMSQSAIDNALQQIQPMNTAESIRAEAQANAENQFRNNVFRTTSRIIDAAERMNVSENGQDVMARMYSPGVDAIEYATEMARFYNQGKNNVALDLSTVENVSPIQAKAEFNAGRQDYIASNAQEEITNERSEEGLRLRTGSERQNGQGAGGSTGVLEKGAGAAQSRQAGSFQREGGYAEVSSESLRQNAEQTITNAGLRVVTNSPRLASAKKYAESHGMNFVAWEGGSLVIDGQQSRGYYDPETNTIYVRADHRLFTAEQITIHETTHGRIHNGEISLGRVDGREETVDLKTVYKTLVKELGIEKFEEVLDAYVEIYAGINISRQGVFEEMICDAMAGMNDFVSAGHFEDALKHAAALQTAKAVTEENAANGERAGPVESGGKYSGRTEVLALKGVNWVDDYSSIRDQLIANRTSLSEMSPIVEIQYAGESGIDLENLIYSQLEKIGGGKISRRPITFDFDRTGIKTVRSHAKAAELRAAAVAAPFVAKKGKLIAGQKNHEDTNTTTLTYAGPVVFVSPDGKIRVPVNVGVVIQFISNGRPHAVNIDVDGGDALKAIEKATSGPRGGLEKTQVTYPLTSGSFSVDNLAEEKRVVKENIEEAAKEFGDSGEYNSEAAGSFSRELDPDVLKKLNNGKTMKVYRSMQVIKGKLYPPMAAKIDDGSGKRKLVEPTVLNEWYKADEHPELLDKNGKFKLDKANGSTLDVAYNPYWHTSNMMLNDQFSSAYNRKNLVTVECEIPVSELTSGYKAQFAKDAVGLTPWHSGPVASQLGNAGNQRNVYLSRWVKVNRIVPDSEVAKNIAKTLKGTDISVPVNTVTPALRSELEKIGVPISEASGLSKKAAAKLNATLSKVETTFDAKTESAAPTGNFSRDTWNESEYVVERNKAAKELAAALGVTIEKAKAYIDNINGVAKAIGDDAVRLDYKSSPGRSSFVSNAEYGGSFDFSTLCKKRRLMTGTMTAIQNALPNTVLTPVDFLKIRNMMLDAGLEASCGLCYVEGSRAGMGQFTKEFIQLYKKYYPGQWAPTQAEMSTPDSIEDIRLNHPEVYAEYENFWNNHGKLRENDPNLFASQQKPKLYQLRTAYNGEILKYFKKDSTIETKNRNGGVRLQSFSDFEIVHLIDTMQIIMDMSRVGLAGQAYTKVPDFALALGNTGLKINLSLITKGVDANGKLIFDDREGMNHETAFKIRDQYSKNVGTILVTFTDSQLKAAMADDRIDFIIPFHRSQWKKSQYAAMGLPANTKDYTYQQNEKWLDQSKHRHEWRGKMVDTKVKNYMPNEWWQPNLSGKENAEYYLEMCAKDGKRPKFYKFLDYYDGQYHLKKDGSTDGYWKLLIDFKMYDNDGNFSPQNSVRPDFNMEEANRMLADYQGGHENFPVAQGIADQFVKEYKDSHKEKKFSRDMDSNYMAAVKSGDMSTVQKMVDEAAKNAGYMRKVYHGTLAGGFTVFDKSYSHTGGNSGAGFYTSTTKTDSENNYADVEGADNFFKARNLAYAIGYAIDEGSWEGPELETYEERLEYAKKQLTKNPQTYTLYGDPGKTYIRDGSRSTNLWPDIEEGFVAPDRADYDSDDDYDDDWRSYYDEHVYEKINSAVRDALSTLENQYEIVESPSVDKLVQEIAEMGLADESLVYKDIEKAVERSGNFTVMHEESGEYDDIYADAEPELVRAIIEAFGYDSITDKEVSWKFNQVKKMAASLEDTTEHVIFFRPNQMKLADAITRDDAGNVIPLSKRFNPKNDDIRFSRELKSEEKRRAGEKLSESQFYSLYSAHKLDMRRQGNVAEQIQKIREEGFKGTGGFMGNTLPTRMTYKTVDGKKVPDNVVVGRYAPRKGEYILLIPRSGLDSQYNVKLGYKPDFDYEIVQADYDYQPYYEMYSRSYDAAKAKESSTDIRYSRDLNADYMAAVESGDTAKQASLVKEAAERAGYTVEGYHGTQQFGFTKIDLSKLDDNMSFFVTNDMGTARTYSTKEAVTNINRSVSIDEMEAEIEEKNKTAYNEAISFGTLLSQMAGIQGWSDIGVLQASLDDIVNEYAESGNEETFKEELWTLLDQETWALFDYMHGQSSDNEDVYYRDDVDDYDEWMESDETERLRKALDEIANAYTDWFYALMRYHNDEYSGNYHVYINPSNLFVLDCKGRQWNSLEGDGKILKETNGGRYWNTRSIAKWAKENGYEGVLFHDVVDDGGRGTIRVKTPADVYALFNPQAQVKSADPVTYDADGNVIPLSERFNPKNDDIRFSRDLTNTDLVNENRELQKAVTELRSKLKTKTEQYKYWKGQTKVTKGRQLRAEDVTKLAREIIKEQESVADVKAVAEKMKSLGEYILNTDEENAYEEARLKAYEIAHDILSNAKILNERGGEHFYKDFRDALMQTPIYVTPSVRDEVSPDGWSGLRQMARGIFTPTADQSKGTSVDKVYHDLQSTFGEWLLPEYITAEADQLNKILEVVETYQPIYENINSYEMSDAVEWTANEILTRIIGNEIRETNPTYADRMEKKLTDQKMKSQEALRKVRENRDKKVANLKEHYQQVAEDRRNRKIDSEMRSRLLAIAKRLHNKKLPRAQRALLDQYIGEIDLVAKSITGRTIENLEQLKTWYEEYKENKGDDFIPDKFIERKLDRLSKKHISEMTQEEVADLTTVLLNFENKIRTQNKLLESKIKADVYAAGLQTIDDINNSHGNKGFLSKAIGAETATPERYIHRITGYRENSPLYQAAKELSDGQRKMLDYQRRAEALFEKWTNDKKFIRSIAGKNADSIKVTGYFDGELFDAYITPAMRMALYLHEKNDDNMRHISKGGVKIPNMTLYRKGKMQEAYDDAIRLVFTRGQIKEITSHMTDKERAFADAISRYYNGMSRDEINAASEILKGYGIAGVDWYYPIDTDGSFLRKDFDSVKRDGSIEGMGFTKERIDNASNPIMLYDINDTLNKSISQHSKYVGLAIPVRNFNKLYTTTSFKSKMAENAYDSTWTYDTSVAEALKENWGSTATKYIEKMMSDIQNGTGLKQDYWGDLMAKARSKYAGAVLNTNLSVAMKQAASYPTAAAVVGYGPLVKALGDVKKADLVKLAQYTPLLWQRMRGYGILEVGDIRNEGKQIPKALNWIQTMDVATTTKLVKAAMIYVNENQKDLTRNSDAWWKAVAEVYNRIIEETQPNYTMMQRPQILRSENALTRALNMFKTQPFQNFNILYDAFGNLAAKTRGAKANPTQENRDALKQARVTAARAVSSQAVSAFVFALMQFAWDAFRGKAKKYKDDDDEMTFASWLKGMGINVLSSVGGMVPFGSYALELGETMTDAILKAFKLDPFFDQTFYGLSENASESVNDMGKALINLVTKISQSLSGGEITESTVRSVVDSMGDIAQFVGIPANNAMNLAKAIARNAFLTTEGKYVGGYHALRVTTDPAKYPGDYYNLLWKAYNNDTAAYNELLQKMLDDGFEESKIKTAMEKRMKESQGVSSVNDLESRFMSPDQQKIYDKELAGIEQTTMFQAATDEQQQALMKKLYNLATDSSAGQKMNEKIVGGASVGLDQTEYLLYTLALSMVDKPNSSGNYGSYTNEEVEAAILMVPGLSNAERAYLWEAAGKTQKTNPWR